jgi:hypothetical protein
VAGVASVVLKAMDKKEQCQIREKSKPCLTTIHNGWHQAVEEDKVRK